MSQTKKLKIGIVFLIAMLSFFMFGCKKNTTPVEDICFDLGESEQIVLIVGQTLEMNNYVEVKPHYATNKNYSISSFDENIVKIENNSLVAVEVGNTYVKVVSSDNALKEDIMSVVVKKTKTTLTAPKNLSYDSATQTFRFDAVPNATSYTLRLNGEEINLGNSNNYNLSQHDENVFDKLLVAEVRANAPTYTYALENSSYCAPMKIYQAGAVKDVQVKNAILTFTKANNNAVSNIYINGNKIADATTAQTFDLNQLDVAYAGLQVRVDIESVVVDSVKETLGLDVEYFNSNKNVEINVLGVPNIKISSTTLSWQNVPYASLYSIVVENNEVAQTTNNYFDLKSLNSFETLISTDVVTNIKVLPLIGEESLNVAKTTAENIIKVKKLATPTLEFNNSIISWVKDNNASAYSISIFDGADVFESSTFDNQLSTKGYLAGNYEIKVQSIAKDSADADEVFYISSSQVVEAFTKKADISADIVNYELIISNPGTDTIKIDFDDNSLDEIKVGNNEDIIIRLKDHKFAVGAHEVIVTRLADNTQQGNFVDGTPYRKEFTQLEKIESATIENGTLKVQKSDTNKHAIVKLSTMGGTLGEAFVVEDDELTYNTTNNTPGTHFLGSGAYSTSIYAYGDGSSTFSYRDDAGVVAVCLVKEFNVLPAPTVAVLNPQNDEITITAVNNAESYDVYNVTTQSKVNVSKLVYPFTLGETGNIQFAVQAIGDNKQYLNSIVSSPITIERLKKPTLTYNHATEIISMKDVNIEGVVSGYEFKHNEEVVNYDFVSKYPLTEDSVFTIQAISVGFKDGVYYLNSSVASLNLTKISNEATISLNEDNQLVISPTSHTERYALEVVFGFADGNHTYVSQGDTLTDGNNTINFEYVDGKYNLELVNENHNAVVEGFKQEFSVAVKFVKPEGSTENLIDSEFTTAANFSLIKISNASKITIDNENKLTITPNDHEQEYALQLIINNGTEMNFVSNGSNKLVGTSGELTYLYNAETKTYSIVMLNEDYSSIINGLNIDFTVKVKYCHNHNGVATDLDSDYCAEKTIDVLPVATILRDGQNLKIQNVQQTYTISNYALLINDDYILELTEQDVSYIEGYFVFDVESVYAKTPSAKLKDINLISVIVKNVDTSEQNPQLSIKSGKIYISKTQTVELTSYKYNNNEDGKNNNSVVVNFEVYKTNYNKQYVVEIYNQGGANKQIKRFEDVNATNGIISFKLDDVSNIEGVIYIQAYVATSDSYVDVNTIQMFNSVKSNEINFEKVESVKNLFVSNSVLNFDEVENVVGYEVFEKKSGSYIKLNTDLVLTNSFVFSNINGEKKIVVKAISKTNGFTNSSYSEEIIINKVATPSISVVDGKFHINLSTDIILLLANDKVKVVPEITNNQSNEIKLDLKNLNGVDIKLVGTTLIAEPYLFLAYNGQSILAENLTLQIRVEYDESTAEVYYINSDVASISAHGLFKPTSISKTTSENDLVEMLTWTESANNVLNGQAVSVGYVLKIDYAHGEDSATYYTNDTKLKYYDNSLKKYVSYPTYITGNSAIFPAGYDADGDGNLDGEEDVKFEAGNYKISIQSVPTAIVEGYNICRSDYTDVYEFSILEQTELEVLEGSVVWEHQEKASKYQVTIYEGDTDDVVLVDTTNVALYDFTNPSLKALSGVYRVVVKAISTREDAVNGMDSVPIYVYRLPEAYDVFIDDGEIVLSSTMFFYEAEFEFVDNTTGSKYIDKLDNSAFASQKLTDLQISTWKGFTDDAKINSSIKNALTLNKEALSIVDGRDYTINVTLKGNSLKDLGLITSSKVVKISGLTTSKLKPNVAEVDLGVIQFMPDSDYATISQNVFTIETGLDLNYMFNNATATQFWHQTIAYKVELTYSEGVLNLFAVDYYSFITAIANGKIDSSEYEILTNTNGLYAYVKYKYNEAETDKYIYFNVFENNIINLRDYDYLQYYQTTSKMTDGVNKFESDYAIKTLNLEIGGSFTLKFFMLGGDSKNSVGHISSAANGLKTFVRYGLNELSSSEGKVKFNNLLPIVAQTTVDNPIYKIVVTPLNSVNSKVFYIYHSTEEDAKKIASRLDADFESATYVKVEETEDQKGFVFFDLSNYVENGAYKASIRTLAGLGTGEDDSDYLLNSKEPNIEYSFYKLSSTQFTSGEGVLEFAQSYIVRDSNNVYYDNYEITLKDVAKQETYVYQIDRTSDGVRINDTTHIVTYTLPAQIVIKTNTIEILSNTNYEIKIKPIAKDNYILNGTHIQDKGQDVVLTFKKSQGLSEVSGEDLRIEDGILKWKVIDPANHVNTVIKISFPDENSQVKHIYVTVADMNKKVTEEGYQYHYYEFTDEKYNLESTGSVYIVDDVEYTISAYVTGRTTAEEIILNSNYSSEIKTKRLSSIGDSIKTSDGVLTWKEIENAVSYDVTITGANKQTVTTETNSLDLFESGLKLPVGTYSVQIRANGTTFINSMKSSIITGFAQLGKVDIATIKIEEGNIVWNAVENAQGYKVVFNYTNSKGETLKDEQIVETNSYTAPLDVVGTFNFTITPVGVGDGKVFNGEFVEYESSKEAPKQVQKFEFDEVNNRFVVEINKNDFLASDKLSIVYNFEEYISGDNKAEQKLKTETISYEQSGRYEVVDENIVRYFYPISIMGVYSNVYVQVVRPETLPSNAIMCEDVDFKLFSYGAGTFDNPSTDEDESNPYRIANAEQLLNIKHFPSANYIITASINMGGVNVMERLNEIGALISDEFGGTLDGNNFTIFGFNKNETNKTDTILVEDFETFALFKTLNEATIKNLTFGEENYQLILLNTFANNTSNVIKLSLIATGANNSTIENIKLLNFKVLISSELTKAEGSINIAGLINEINATTLTNVTEKLEVNIDMQLSNNVEVRIGGVATTATNSNIIGKEVAETSVNLKVETKVDNLLSYVGGVVAYYIGNTAKSTGITNTSVELSINNVQAIYLGGLIGFARNVNIQSCETTGTYAQSNVNYSTYVGGLVGYVQSSTIQNSGSFMDINITLASNTGDVFVGAIAGMLTIQNNISCQVVNCYSHVYNKDQLRSEIDAELKVVVGIYGNEINANITVSCYKKEQ